MRYFQIEYDILSVLLSEMAYIALYLKIKAILGTMFDIIIMGPSPT